MFSAVRAHMPANEHSVSTAAKVAHHALKHVPSVDPLVRLTNQRWTLEGASDFWSVFLQVATVIVVLGVIIEVIATALEVRDEIREGHKVRVHHFLTFVGGALIVLAVAGEFWAEMEGASLETRLRTDNALAQAILSDRSNTAIADVVLTIAKFGGLKNLVGTTERKIAGEVSDFQKRTAADIESAKQTIAGARDTIAELNRDRTDLTKARDETEAAEKKAEAVVAAAAAANAPRSLLPKQQDDLVAKLKASPGLMANLLIPPSTTPDTGPLASLLEELLTKAGWKVGLMQTLGGWSKTVLVCTGKSPKLAVEKAATIIVLELRAAGIASFVDVDMGPQIPASGSGSSLPNPDMTIIIGSKQ
jgi:hypothetical protein